MAISCRASGSGARLKTAAGFFMRCYNAAMSDEPEPPRIKTGFEGCGGVIGWTAAFWLGTLAWRLAASLGEFALISAIAVTFAAAFLFMIIGAVVRNSIRW